MPAPTSTDELLELVRRSELIPPQRLEAFLLEVRGSLRRIAPRDLTNQLLAAGLITNFQAEQFLQGKWRGFTLGKYKVLERLGSGGMGTVYLCEHMLVRRRVAVKVLPTSQSTNPAALGRFYREARAAGTLDHPNLVKAHDIDEEGGLHFLVMDYVDGSSLQDIVSRFGALSIERSANYICQAARGLQAAHEANLVHRDIKPGNILLERNGNVRVLDLGLARFANDNEDLLTLQYDEKNVLGTADYVAPEQALNSHDVDIRADIYSLGATFYYLLTGQPLFPVGKVAQKLIWHQVRQPTPIRELRAEIPDGLADVIGKMLAKEPADRYQTPAEVAEALKPWGDVQVPPPTTQEMPTLSIAASAPSTEGGAGARVSRVVPAVSRQIPTPAQRRETRNSVPELPRPSHPGVELRPEPKARASTLPHRMQPAPEADELATPRMLASETPTETEHPRAKPAIAPSQMLAKNKQPAPPPPAPSESRNMILAIVLVVLSSLAGVALSIWLSGR